MLDYRLIHAINTGRCFALVGAGPSSELGYPSWQHGVDPLSWTPKDWGRTSSERESTCQRHDPATPRNSGQRRSGSSARVGAPRSNWPRIWAVAPRPFATGSSKLTL